MEENVSRNVPSAKGKMQGREAATENPGASTRGLVVHVTRVRAVPLGLRGAQLLSFQLSLGRSLPLEGPVVLLEWDAIYFLDNELSDRHPWRKSVGKK